MDKFNHHDVTEEAGKFKCVDDYVVLEFYGERSDDPSEAEYHAFYLYVYVIESNMRVKGYSVIDRDDGTDSADYLCWTHFGKVMSV